MGIVWVDFERGWVRIGVGVLISGWEELGWICLGIVGKMERIRLLEDYCILPYWWVYISEAVIALKINQASVICVGRSIDDS